MEKQEELIGTFLYAAVQKREYEAFRLIFTTTSLISASRSWRKNNNLLDLLVLLTKGRPGPRAFQTLMMKGWSDIKNNNKGKPVVSYDDLESREISELGLFGMIMHGVTKIPYTRIKRILLEEYPLTNDYKLRFDSGPFTSSTYLIPDTSIQAFKELVGKTPLLQKLNQRQLAM